MNQAFDVAIVGAGPVGASIAWHLAQRGVRRILLLERASRLGTGSAAVATGGFRAQFGTEVNVRLSLLSRAKLQRFAREVGGDPGYEPAGYLFLATTASQLTSLRDGLLVQRACGLEDAIEVTRAEIASIQPHVRLDDVVGGTFCPSDGFLRPLAILEGYVRGAVRSGVTLALDCGAVEWLVDPGDPPRVRGVRAGDREFACPVVVIAAGAWSGLLSAHGVEIPVQPERRQIAVGEPFSGLPARMPMTIDCSDGFHFRMRDGRLLLLRPDAATGSDPLDTRFDPSWLQGLLVRAHDRLPASRTARIDLAASACGLYEMTPDKHALLGPVRAVQGLFLATGNSGHGVMHAPALGQLAAEMIVHASSNSLDARALRPDRFAENDPNPPTGVL